MTTARYILCRIALTFGYSRKNTRMGDAAAEMHLLKEAESYLGKEVWQNVENIEELSAEYWNLRKLVKEHDRVTEAVENCQKTLAKAQEERAALLGVSNQPFQDLIDQRREVLRELEDFARQRDIIVAKARDVRKLYDGIQTKVEVLNEEGRHSPDEMAKVTARLAELKQEFSALKEERLAVAEKIAEGDAEIDKIDEEIKERKSERRNLGSQAFQRIGEANQEMSALRAELGVLDTQMRQLYSEIGRHVSRQAHHNPPCRKAVSAHRGLVDVMAALRKSVNLNQRLAEHG